MQTIEREYPQAEVLMGTSTAGIAHAAIVGHMMKLPMGYVRARARTMAGRTRSKEDLKRVRRS